MKTVVTDRRRSGALKRQWCAIVIAWLAASLANCAQAQGSLDKGYAFLDRMMDTYAKGSAPRLIQSFVSTPTFSTGTHAYTYDSDVAIIALLRHGRRADISRATVLGNALLYVQQHDPANDGRVRDAYDAQRLVDADGSPHYTSADTHAGNMAWTGMALMQLYHATGAQLFLAGAEQAANFVQTKLYDTRGAGGYMGGILGSGGVETWKATEHNIDLYALFGMLAIATGTANWNDDASHALSLVQAMWDAKGRHFYIGTKDDGATINTSAASPEDIQTWSYLATGLTAYQSSIDWSLAHLSATSGDFAGLSFEVKDRSGVWFEGTAHAAEALRVRNLFGDAQKAARLLSDVESGQMRAPNADGYGIDAASKDGLRTGEGSAYFAALHVGATAWYCLARQSANPFKFLVSSNGTTRSRPIP